MKFSHYLDLIRPSRRRGVKSKNRQQRGSGQAKEFDQRQLILYVNNLYFIFPNFYERVV